jgi:hypothetical protein
MSRIKDYSNLPSFADLIALDKSDFSYYEWNTISKCCLAPINSIVAPGMEHILNEEGKDTRGGCQRGDYIYICTKCNKENDDFGWERIEKNTKEQYQKRRVLDGY